MFYLVLHFTLSPRAVLAYVVLCLLVVAGEGCLWRPRKERVPAAKETAWLGAPAGVEIGRILAFDPKARTALVEIPAHLPLQPDLAGRSVVVRNLANLASTAHGVVSPHRAGRIFGIYVIDGVPSVEDEVVLVAKP